MIAAGAVEVEMWNAETYIQEIIHRRGFCCLICGARTAFEKRGRMYDITIEAAVWRRQTIFAPTLICMLCAIEVPALTGAWLPDRKRQAVADALVQRVMETKIAAVDA